MYCKNCGREISDESVSCPYCGEKISGKFNKNQNSLTAQEKRKQYSGNKTRLIICSCLSALVIVLIVLIYQVVSLNRQLSEAKEAENVTPEDEDIAYLTPEEVSGIVQSETEQSEMEQSGKEQSEIELFLETADSMKNESVEIDTISSYTSVGDLVYYGTYEQDNRFENGNEPIEWLVLDKKGSQYLLITSKVIDAVSYNNVWTETTWGNCSLRKWLNESFLEEAFSDEQKRSIAYTKYTDNDGFITNDQVFILDGEELRKYFDSMEERASSATPYAEAQGVYAYINGNSWWWVRDAGADPHYAAYVNCLGDILDYGILVFNNAFGVRPVIRVNK